MSTKQEKMEAFGRLLEIMDDLREKCPWDKKQTLESLRILTLEETYELSDAIVDNNLSEIEKELGDLMLLLVFYAKIGSEKKEFDIKSVLDKICGKLIYRHPHIYSDTEVNSEEEVKANWEKLKLKEGQKSVLEGVPKSLPALVKAYRIQEKIKGIGFEFETDKQVLDKLKEEIEEFESADDIVAQKDEFGDVLFSLINYARFKGINPEDALSSTNQKFINRFMKMEELLVENGKSIDNNNLEILDLYWNKAKKALQ